MNRMNRPRFRSLGTFPADDPPRNILINLPGSMVRALETVALASRQSRNAIIRHAISMLVVRLHQACKPELGDYRPTPSFPASRDGLGGDNHTDTREAA